MDLGATERARQYLTRSIRLSQATGARISIARAGLPPGRGTESCPAPARPLGEAAVARLWARGLAMSGETAIALARQGRTT